MYSSQIIPFPMLLSLGFFPTAAAINRVREQGFYFYTIQSEKCLLEFDAKASRKKRQFKSCWQMFIWQLWQPFVGSTSDKALTVSDHHTTCAHFLQYFIQELHSPVSVISYKATDSYSKYKNYPHFLQFACIAPLIADFDCFTPDNSKHLEMLCFETTYSVVDWPLESEVDQTLTDIPGRGG